MCGVMAGSLHPFSSGPAPPVRAAFERTQGGASTKDHTHPPEAARRRKDRNQKRAMEAKSLRVLGRRAPQASARP